jgi:hypothetical protein
LAKIISPEPVFVSEKVLLKLFPPEEVTFPDPVLVILTGLLNELPLNETDALLVDTLALNVVPENITVPEQLNAPLLIEPPTKLAEPLTSNVNPLRLSEPELMVKLFRPEISTNEGLNVPVCIVTSSPRSGVPDDGDQLEALPQSVETPPIHV